MLPCLQSSATRLPVSFRSLLTHPVSSPEKIKAADRLSFARFSPGVPTWQLSGSLLGLSRPPVAFSAVDLSLKHPVSKGSQYHAGLDNF
jgi:hypothetical protein